MIDLYYWPTPNGHKITIFLEETGLFYKLVPIDIGAGDQFNPEFLTVSPNNKIPAIVDHAPSHGSRPLTLFESGAILLYLADKTQQFLPKHLHDRYNVLQWLFWQMASLGPMAGQNHHFVQYASEKIPYAIDRYLKETSRLYAVLDKQLSDKDYITGDYSIADMACYPWIVPYEKQQQNLNHFPHLKRWFENVQERPAVKRAYALRQEINPNSTLSEEAKRILFGQDASHVKR
jgi:GSH-dependent disulfide-bond oxidoreductase